MITSFTNIHAKPNDVTTHESESLKCLHVTVDFDGLNSVTLGLHLDAWEKVIAAVQPQLLAHLARKMKRADADA